MGLAATRAARPAAWAPLALALVVAWAALVPAGGAFGAGPAERSRDDVFKQVESLTRYGEYEDALSLLEDLYARYPWDETVVVSFFDFLVGREMYDRACKVMENYLDFRPSYVGGMVKLAEVYFEAGETEKAGPLLERFIEAAHNRPWAYETAAQAYINAGLNDDALRIVERGRAQHGDAHLLCEQAARAYAGSGRYAEAVEEYLGAVEAEALTEDVARARIVAMAREPEAKQAVVAALRRAGDEGAAGLVALTSLWRMAMADGDCASGIKDLTRIVRADRRRVGLVVKAARQFEVGGCFGECAEAYGLAASITSDEGDAADYLLARGMCEERGGDLEAALATYADFTRTYADSRRAFDGHLAQARVLRAMGRCGDAVGEADVAIEIGASSKNLRKAVLLKADCLVILERFEDAKATYDLVRPDWDPAQAQRAYYNLGEICFYEHDFDAALSYFNVTASEYPGETLANDAIERLILIRGARAGEAYAPELGAFADAALLERQGKVEEAVALLRGTAAAGPAEVRVQSLKGLVRLYLAAGDHERALEICRLAGETMESYWSPVALETAGDIYLELGMRDEAVSAYENVIVNYPESVSAGEARRKLDLVGGKEGE